MLKVLAEGGSLAIVRTRDEKVGERYSVVGNQAALLDLLSAEERDGLGPAVYEEPGHDDLEAAIVEANYQPWHWFSPATVHADARATIWEAYVKRMEPAHLRYFDRWVEQCAPEGTTGLSQEQIETLRRNRFIVAYRSELASRQTEHDSDVRAREIGILKGFNSPPRARPASPVPAPGTEQDRWLDWLMDNQFEGFDESDFEGDLRGILVLETRADTHLVGFGFFQGEESNERP